MAQRFTEAELRKWFGWSRNSDIPSRYVHLASEDLEDALANLHGLSQDKKEQNRFVPKQCPKCGNDNVAPTQNWCGDCGAPLEPKSVEELEEKESRAIEFIYKNDDIKKRYLEYRRSKEKQ